MRSRPKASDPREPVNRVEAKSAEHAPTLASDLDEARKAGRRRIKLEELITQFKPEHRHGEWDLGDPVGNEVW